MLFIIIFLGGHHLYMSLCPCVCLFVCSCVLKIVCFSAPPPFVSFSVPQLCISPSPQLTGTLGHQHKGSQWHRNIGTLGQWVECWCWCPPTATLLWLLSLVLSYSLLIISIMYLQNIVWILMTKSTHYPHLRPSPKKSRLLLANTLRCIFRIFFWTEHLFVTAEFEKKEKSKHAGAEESKTNHQNWCINQQNMGLIIFLDTLKSHKKW